MGWWSKIKGWLNIGGVKVSILEVQPVVDKAGAVRGSFQMLSKTDRKVKKVVYKFFMIETKGTGEDKKVTEETIAESTQEVAYEVKAGQPMKLDFELQYDMGGFLDRMSQKGGVMGAMGKMAKFVASATAEKGIRDYFVQVTCDVEGTALDPSDKTPVRVSAAT